MEKGGFMQGVAKGLVRVPLATALALAAYLAPATARDLEDHYEFDASFNAPYQADGAHFRTFELQFRFPGADDGSVVAWRVDILSDYGFVVRTWRGESALADGRGDARIQWSERDAENGVMPFGIYHARMTAYAVNPITQHAIALSAPDERVDLALGLSPDEVVEQTFDIAV